MNTFGHFDDAEREFVVTDPLTPTPWINYLGNTRLSAFISQQAGGLEWNIEPQQRRLTRSHWLPAARRALVEKSEALLLKEWREHGHMHENYCANTGQGCNAERSDAFYHWGGLLGLIALLEKEQSA